MKPFARATLRLFLGVETLAFAWSYFLGVHGLPAVVQMRHKNDSYLRQNQQLEQEINTLQKEIEGFKRYPFYKQRYAREQLHMARPNEIVYLRS